MGALGKGTDMSKDPTFSTEAVLVPFFSDDQRLVNLLTTIIDKLRNGTAPLNDYENEIVARITEGYTLRGKAHYDTTNRGKP